MGWEGRDRLFFFQKTIFRMARSWAKIPRLPWSEIESTNFAHCPRLENIKSLSEDHQVTTAVIWNFLHFSGLICTIISSQHAVIALGVYCLESGCQHADRIVPYLTKLESMLPSINIEDKKSTVHRKLVNWHAECFPYLLNFYNDSIQDFLSRRILASASTLYCQILPSSALLSVTTSLRLKLSFLKIFVASWKH